ncbi:Hypothetical predicted protein [Mytilus galloprovincialis]|uniref:Uncharacterized protein n=1 Tax=Mytilus galloprovincialis TaxID=29158 RepID=A0A8B6C7M2_MYTGA|nr:Hypothetical predicted protein [Mytilus galloprovincialis]
MQELLETRLCILENQTAQNMSMNTAPITQLSLHNRSIGHYHPHLQHNLQQSDYPPQQTVPLLPQWNTHPAYSQTHFSNHTGFTQHQPQYPFQTNSHLATGYPGFPQQTSLPPTYAHSSHQSNHFVTTDETHPTPIEHSQISQVSSHQTTDQIAATDNIQSPNRTGIIKSNSPFRNNCLQEKPPEQKERLELLV